MRDPLIRLAPRRGAGEHPGLLLTRFLARDVVGDKPDPEEKQALLADACASAQQESLIGLYRQAYDRWCEAAHDSTHFAEVRTSPHTRLIVGLGNKGVIETGLRLHHTYGVPLIPGSALKGLASHYCHEVYGVAEAPYLRGRDFHNLLFGTCDDGGVIHFEDAWMLPDSLREQGLLADVMTPHHQRWQTDPNSAPTDFDSPVPVPFLSVAGRFRVAVSWQGPKHPQQQAWTRRAIDLLLSALADWGVGGKTSSGYGRVSLAPGQQVQTVFSAAALGLPAKGARVEATLLEKPKKNKSWRAQLLSKPLSGPIENSEAVPPTAAQGDKVTLVVTEIGERLIKFKWAEPKKS